MVLSLVAPTHGPASAAHRSHPLASPSRPTDISVPCGVTLSKRCQVLPTSWLRWKLSLLGTGRRSIRRRTLAALLPDNRPDTSLAPVVQGAQVHRSRHG